jgi:hypothetical protein
VIVPVKKFISMSSSSLPPETLSSCLQVLDELSLHPIADIFLNPVDPELDGVPTYFDIVKHPSDLGTVRANLLSHKYQSLEEFSRDVNLIWDNAVLFNGSHSMIGFMAERLRHIFQKRISLLQSCSPDLWTSDYFKSQQTMCKLFRAQPNVMQELSLSPDLEMLVPERKMARSWLSPEDVKLFAAGFKFIEDPAQIAKLVHILSEYEPSIDLHEKDLQINLAALSQRTIRMLRGCVTEMRDQASRRAASEPFYPITSPA